MSNRVKKKTQHSFIIWSLLRKFLRSVCCLVPKFIDQLAFIGNIFTASTQSYLNPMTKRAPKATMQCENNRLFPQYNLFTEVTRSKAYLYFPSGQFVLFQFFRLTLYKSTLTDIDKIYEIFGIVNAFVVVFKTEIGYAQNERHLCA